MQDVVKVLKDRGFLGFVDDEEFLKEISTRPIAVYIGYDPSARSLHLGNLLTLMGLAHFQRAGHKVVCLIGGGTGMIGDPSGKSEERVLLDQEAIESNSEHIRKQFQTVIDLDSEENPGIIANNIDWIGKLSFVEFLREVGKHFRVNEMLNKESVKKRMDSDEGMSLTEFCYQSLQAYDFYMLNKLHGCELQAGGMDQWGNIAAGIDLTRRMSGKKVHGLCFPLLTKADGSKFGKTESGAIYLDPEVTSPFQMYQFWINSADQDVINFLKLFTFMELDEIAKLEASMNEHPELREAQKALALEQTKLIHGQEEAEKAKIASEKLFSGQLKGLTDEQMKMIFPDVPASDMPKSKLSEGLLLIDLLAESGLCKSKGDARRQVKGGGIYVNGERMLEQDVTLSLEDMASEHYMILRRGKKTYHLVKFD